MFSFLKCLFIVLFIPSCFAVDTLKAGVFNIVPYGYLKNGQLKGIIPDLISEIQKESNIKITTQLLPYKRMISSLADGSIDFAIFFLSDASSLVSDKVVDLYDLDTVAIARKGIYLRKKSDILKYQLVTPRGVKYNADVLKDERVKMYRVLDYNHGVHMLKENRADILIGPRKILNFQIRKLEIKNETFEKPFLLIKNTAWLQFSKVSSNDKKLSLKLKKACEKIKKNGRVESIIESYYESIK